MTANTAIDAARRAALDQIDKSERARKRAVAVAGAIEAVLLVAILITADFGDPLHRLIFFSACLVYGTLGIGLVALGAHVNVSLHRVLRAIEESAAGHRQGAG